MAYITGTKRDGSDWTPSFVMEIDPDSCIGCGRCYKACAFDVLMIEEVEDEETDTIKMIMQISNEGNCIGCMACSKACPKDCFSHAPVEA